MAIAQSARTSLSRQVADRAALQEQLTAPGTTQAQPTVQASETQPENAPDNTGETDVTGYEMEKMVPRMMSQVTHPVWNGWPAWWYWR
ncbi:MAG: hypothetical protein U5K27_02195 [Desulfotignum sp.]|nr:hypothetical protein [Desulfotignum sp.]